jgi:hypothetical protein
MAVLPDGLSRLYGPGVRPFPTAIQIAAIPEGAAGLPILRRNELLSWETRIAWQDDWLSSPPLALGGGGATDVSLHDMAQFFGPFPVVAKASASRFRQPSKAGPVLDASDADSHLPLTLAKLGDTVDITPEEDRAEALKWAHAQGHKGLPHGGKGMY